LLEKIKRIDWSIVLILLLFMALSTLLIYSATVSSPQYQSKGLPQKNVIFYVLGLFCFFFMTFLDFRILVKIAPYLYGLGIVLLGYTFFFGEVINKAKGWIKLSSSLEFQPAELLKLILIISITAFIARRQGAKLELLRDVIPVSAIGLLPFILVFMENDLGNAIIYLIILLGMFWIGNIKFKYVLIGTVIIVSVLSLVVYFYTHYHEPITKFLMTHHKEHWPGRLDTFLYPNTASDADAYQVKQATRAIGSGMLTGDGYLKGDSIHRNFVPVAYTDSIFAVIGEEFGFIGASALLLLYFLLIYRMILISIQTLDLSGSYIIVGIVSMFVFQVYENIGMLIGLMPLTGITLPFISYGGTSLIINMVSIGIVMSVRVHQEKVSMFQN
jgi:rod shape determining protein RodA